MSIKLKMAGAIIAALSLLFISNLATQFLIAQTNQAIDRIVNENDKKVALINSLKHSADERELILLDMVLIEEEDEGYEQKMDGFKKGLERTAKEIFDIFEALNASNLQPKEEDIYQRLRTNVSGANLVYASFNTAISEGFREEAIDILHNEFRPKYKDFASIVSEFLEYENQLNATAVTELKQQQSDSSFYLWTGLIISMLMFAVVGGIVARSLLIPINGMRNTLLSVAENGDLKQRVEIKGKDELAETGQALNKLLETVQQSTDSVNKVLVDMAAGDCSGRVEGDLRGDFASMKEQVNRGVEQMSAVVRLLQTTAHNFREGVLETADHRSVNLSGAFLDVVTDLDASAQLIRQTVDSISDTLGDLARGNFSVRNTKEVVGDFVPLQSSLNRTLNDLENFVNEVSQVQAKISEGDLTQLVEGVYQGKMALLKDSLNSSVRNTASMVAKVGAVTESVVQGVSNMAAGNADISDRVRDQAQALVSASSSMEQMTQSVRQNADSAQQANQVTIQARDKLTNGLQSMQQALKSTETMAEANQKISDIITMIDSIAFQTNLLALNAAVEAARAGEHGRGFAVVAGEVRNLAAKSAEAAGEIKKLIENSVAISEQSSNYVAQTSDALQVINHSIGEMAEMIEDISTASSEQTQGIEQVNQSVSSMDQSTQRNASLIEQAAEESQKVLDNAHSLQQQVLMFKVDSQVQARMLKIADSRNGEQFEKMVEAHLAWKAKIRAFVDGENIGVSYDAATDHTACVLGKWYYGEGQALMHLPLMKDLGEEHMQMHQAIKRVMDAKSIEDYETVDQGLADVDRQSEKVVNLLYQLMDQAD
ncbi:methyl-accepting chemotaxis protein [Thiomicrorhabdus xiamenensis]|nr:methyl-accepting chemotaxis protein [Thiomicrorhabdus xiamenensis]